MEKDNQILSLKKSFDLTDVRTVNKLCLSAPHEILERKVTKVRATRLEGGGGGRGALFARAHISFSAQGTKGAAN